MNVTNFVDIVIDNDEIMIKLSNAEKVLSFHNSLRFRVSQISEISDTLLPPIWKEIRAPGIAFPGIKTGTYYTSRGKEFWLFRDKENPIRIELNKHSFKRIILGIKDHQKWLGSLNDLREKTNNNSRKEN